MLRIFAWGSLKFRILKASMISIHMLSFPILYFAPSQQTHQLHSSPVRLSCFLSICCISLLINLTAIAPVNSFRVNCFFSFRTLSEYICLKRCAISESSSKSCIVRIYDLMSKCVMIVYQNAIVKSS